MVKIILGVMSAISFTTLIFLLLKQLRSKNRHIDAPIKHGNYQREAPQEATPKAKSDKDHSSADSLVEEENSGDSIYDNFELFGR